MKIVLLILLFSMSCSPNTVDINEKDINTFLDNWHHAAAIADENQFFSSMAEDGVYIGTDKTEIWFRDELKEWSKTFFKRESAWSFRPYDRRIYSSDNKRIVWFDELLDTPNLGICRASGVLENIGGEWKIKHYQLSVTLDNDLVDDYLNLVEEKKKEKMNNIGHKE